MARKSLDRHTIKETILADIDNETFSIELIAQAFLITKKTVHQILDELLADTIIKREKKGRYALVERTTLFTYENKGLDEHTVYMTDVKPLLSELSQNAHRTFAYIFTEMFNNAIDHSQSDRIEVTVLQNACRVTCSIRDNGIGIFENIRQKLNLADKKYAILELAKGKLTTDKTKHSGEGIFFASKAGDAFYIFSDDLTFASVDTEKSYLFSNEKNTAGTEVVFSVKKDSKIVLREVMQRYSEDPELINFNKTIVPVSLLGYGEKDAFFVSRSQAKRLSTRFEKFENVVLDFDGVAEIGQAFADELFRVFQNEHPRLQLTYINCVPDVANMIGRIKR
ncbi:MAG: DUF4325 domain-containing protein [Clostridiales bacterium]|jgi:anti-sigma regulatory factor (Ser/Thr protein kinase)|nr:DUF4325 domain-containing protein [Clostridiales bacterium]